MAWFRWQSAVDFAVLAAVLYLLLLWAKETRALRLVLTILGLHASARLVRQFDLTITGWILDIASVLLALMLVFLFQPELRRAFMRLDGLMRLGLQPGRALESGYYAVSAAAFSLATEGTGALIVLARRDSLRELVSGGTAIGAELSPEILAAIFHKNSPIHDGAVLIEANRISRAGVVLPLTQREAVPAKYGTRHRAAMGMAERCDALVIAVSEERGDVTLMHRLNIVQVRDAAELFRLLRTLAARAPVSLTVRVRGWLFANLGYKLVACGLAGLLWGMSALTSGTDVRVVSVPVEFADVPAEMEIAGQSATRLEVQLRGPSWFLSPVSLTGLVARFNLRDAGTGSRTLRVSADTLSLPPGVVVEGVRPDVITVRLVRRAP